MTQNMQRNFATAGGPGADDAGPGVSSAGASFTPYRTRGIIDLNENRLPNQNDVTIVMSEAIVGYDAFVCISAGTPPVGVTGATSVNPGDYLVYVSGDATLPAGWVAINLPDATAKLANCPPRYVRIVGQHSGINE